MREDGDNRNGFGEIGPMWIAALAALITSLGLFTSDEPHSSGSSPTTAKIEISITITVDWPWYDYHGPASVY